MRFAILAQYDSNGDNQITSADQIWDSLLIWRDDGDAISQASELTNITNEDIVSIDLNDVRPGRLDRKSQVPTVQIPAPILFRSNKIDFTCASLPMLANNDERSIGERFAA